jgi:hypothetical protein
MSPLSCVCAELIFDPASVFIDQQAKSTIPEFERILGTFDRTHCAKFATYYWWDDLGLQALQESDSNFVAELTFAFNDFYRDTRNWTNGHGPHNPFSGELKFGNFLISSETNCDDLESNEFRRPLSRRTDILRKYHLSSIPIVVFLAKDMLISTLSIGLESTGAE